MAASVSSVKTSVFFVSELIQRLITALTVMLWLTVALPVLFVSIFFSTTVMPEPFQEESRGLAGLLLSRLERSFWSSFTPPCVLQVLMRVQSTECDKYVGTERERQSVNSVPERKANNADCTDEDGRLYNTRTQEDSARKRHPLIPGVFSSTSDTVARSTTSARVEALPDQRRVQRTPDVSPPTQRAIEEAMPQSPSPSVEELQNLLSKSRKFNKDFNRRFRSSQERLNEMMS